MEVPNGELPQSPTQCCINQSLTTPVTAVFVLYSNFADEGLDQNFFWLECYIV